MRPEQIMLWIITGGALFFMFRVNPRWATILAGVLAVFYIVMYVLQSRKKK